ncbi:MAG: NYN domain-containing protein, partial [Gemmatimonadota bacterium]
MNESYMRAPHRRSGAEDSSTNAALLIDFDNVTMGIRSNLGHELRKLLDSEMIRGKVAVQRAYADWRRYPQYIVPLSEASIDLIFAPAYGSSKKNATDIRLAIDALELVFTRPEIGTYILLSGDSDFSSLVLKLKEYGKYVIGVGMQESSSDLLVQNCDEYYSYNSISGLTSAAEAGAVKHDPWVLAARAIRRMVERGDVMRSDRFKQVMLELDGSFDEKDVGFSKFNRFVTEAASRGIVVLEKAANGQYEVGAGPRATNVSDGSAPPEDRPSASPASSRSSGSGETREQSRERRSRGRSRSRREESRERTSRQKAPPAPEETPEVDEDRLRAAYRLLQDVTVELAGPGEPVRDSEVKRRMLEKDGKFDEGALGFRKFSRFLRQAHDEEMIDLERGPEGNYLVSPAGDGARSGARSPGEVGGARAPDRSEPDRPEAESRPRGRGREPRRGGRARDRAGREPGHERPEEPAAERRAGPEPERRAEREPELEPRAEAPAERAGHDESDAAAAPTTKPESGPEDRHRVTLGRFRRGSRGRAPSAPGRTVVPGPVETGGGREAPLDAHGLGDVFVEGISGGDVAQVLTGRRVALRAFLQRAAKRTDELAGQPSSTSLTSLHFREHLGHFLGGKSVHHEASRDAKSLAGRIDPLAISELQSLPG